MATQCITISSRASVIERERWREWLHISLHIFSSARVSRLIRASTICKQMHCRCVLAVNIYRRWGDVAWWDMSELGARFTLDGNVASRSIILPLLTSVTPRRCRTGDEMQAFVVTFCILLLFDTLPNTLGCFVLSLIVRVVQLWQKPQIGRLWSKKDTVRFSCLYFY